MIYINNTNIVERFSFQYHWSTSILEWITWGKHKIKTVLMGVYQDVYLA
jgi:hypothetical protein